MDKQAIEKAVYDLLKSNSYNIDLGRVIMEDDFLNIAQQIVQEVEEIINPVTHVISGTQSNGCDVDIPIRKDGFADL